MSTKTTFKRVALIAVASLGLGVLTSVAPANATVASLTAIAVSKNSETPTGTALAAGYYTANKLVSANGISAFTVTAGATVTPKIVVIGDGLASGDTGKFKAVLRGIKTLHDWANNSTTVVADGADFTLSAFTAPTVAGDYQIDVTYDIDGTLTDNTDIVTTTVTMKVVAADAFSPGISSAYISRSNGTSEITSDGTNLNASKTMGTTNAFEISVRVKDAGNVLYKGLTTLTASITGAGGLASWSDATTPSAGQCSASTVKRSVDLSTFATGGGIAHVYVCADGTAGTGTITISAVDSAGTASQTIATKTVTFYGAATKFVVSTTNYSVGKAAGGTTGYYNSGTVSARAAATDVPAFIIKATDANGALATSTNTLSGKSSDLTVATGATCQLDDGTSTLYSSGTGVGYYNCYWTSASSAASGKSATLTFRALDPVANDGVTYIATSPVTVTIGGTTPKSVKLSTDKATYAPGEKVTLTLTATDSSGNPVADSTYADMLDSTYLVSSLTAGGLPTASKSVTTIAGKKTYTVYAPVSGSSFTISGVTGVDTATPGQAISVSATLNNADSVIASLLSKINALAKIIAKIQKKLGVK